MDPIIERLKKLLALATNPSTPVEEARSAALIAARTIVEKGVTLSMESTIYPDGTARSQGFGRPFPAPGFHRYDTPTVDLSDFFAAIFRSTEAARTRDAEPKVEVHNVTKKRRRRVVEDEDSGGRRRSIVVGRCGTCGDVYQPGDWVHWRLGSRSNCVGCGPIGAKDCR